MNIFKQISPFTLIFCFSFLVHVPGLSLPLLDYHAYRQCQTASMARNYARHGMHFFQPELDTEGAPARAGTEFPLYSYVLAILFKVFGVRDLLGRILSAVFAAWGAVYLYRLARLRLPGPVAVASALVMCVIPVHIYFTRTVQPEPLALCGLLGFVYHSDRWLRAPSRSSDWLKALLFGALGPLLKLPTLYLIVPLGMLLAWEHRVLEGSRLFAFLGLITGILGSTAAWYAYTRTAKVTVLPLGLHEQLINLHPALSWRLWNDHFVSRFPELCATYPGLLLGLAGAYELKKRKELRFWLGWFVATALYVVLLGEYGLMHRYTELPFAPINAVFIATGIGALWKRTRRRPWWKTILLVLVLGVPLHAALRIKHWYRLEYPWVFRARQDMARWTRPADLVITNTREHPVLLYHLDRYGYAPDLEETGLKILDDYRSQGARYFLTPTAESWSRHPEWAVRIARKARLVLSDPDYLIYEFLQQ